MIVFICSPMGTGKTLTLTGLGKYLQEIGFDIYSNYPVKFPHKPITNPLEIDTIKNGIFLGDELWNWMDSRVSARKQNQVISGILLKSRKRGFHVLHTAQFFSQPDKRLREHTDILAVPEYNDLDLTCFVTCYNYLGRGNVNPLPASTFTFNAAAIFGLYDSYEGIYEEVKESKNRQRATRRK